MKEERKRKAYHGGMQNMKITRKKIAKVGWGE